MLRALAFIVCVSFISACGTAPSRRGSTHEGAEGDANSAINENPAFHSLLGWEKPVTYFIESNAPDEVIEASLAAAKTWGDAVGHEILVFKAVANSQRGGELYDSLDDNSTFIYYEPKWDVTTSKAQTTLATTVWENAKDSDRIVKGDIILNAQTYTFLDAASEIPDSVEEGRVVDAETVLLHEFGHLLGLDHVTEDMDADSIMHAKTFIGPNLTFRTLSEGDHEHIKQLYP